MYCYVVHLFTCPYWYLQVLAERYRQRYPLGGAYVTAYEARPQLHVRSERNHRFVALSFVEAVDQDKSVPASELLSAYRVAGDAFRGRMKRLFLVLDDDEAARQPAKANNQKKTTKRPASGEGTSGTASSKKKNQLPSTQ
jgi:hypothetical protein